MFSTPSPTPRAPKSLQQSLVALQALVGESLRDPFFYAQLLLFALLTALAWLLARRLSQLRWALLGWRHQAEFAAIYFPLLGLVGGRLLSTALSLRGMALPLFERLYALFWILLLYRAAALLVRRYAPDSAPLVQRRVLLPLALLGVILRLGGQLGPLLEVLNRATLFTWGEGEGAFTVPVSLLLFGPLFLFLTYVLAQGLRTLLIEEALPEAGMSTSRAYALGTLVGYAVVVVGIILTLRLLGIAPSTLAVVGSALAVGFGFGLQNTVNNLVSGFLIMFDPMIAVGDLIEVADERGVIRHVGVRNTVIEAADGTRVVMPNATLASTPVLNLSRSSRPARGKLTIPVTVQADPQQVSATIRAVLDAQPEVAAQPAPQVILQGFNSGLMNFELTFWVDEVRQLNPVTHALNVALWQRLHEQKITLSPPA